MDERGFASFLVGEKILNDSGLAKARKLQEVFPARLDTILAAAGIVDEQSVEKALGRFMNARTVGKTELDMVDRQVAWMLSPRVVRRFQALPFRKEGKRISIVSLEPLDLLVEDELSMLTGCMVTSFVAVEFRVMECLAKLHGFELSPQLDAIIKKMRGLPSAFTGVAPTLPKDPSEASPPARQATPPEPSLPTKRPEPVPPARQQQNVQEIPTPEFIEIDELEMDEEDLALFPTLGTKVVDDKEAPTAEAESTQTAVAAGGEQVVPEQGYTPVEAPPETKQGKAEEASAPGDPITQTALADPELSPEERLAIAAGRLQGAEMRDDIGDAILEFCEPYLKRRLLLVMRKDTIVGWRGAGEGIDELAVRAISIPLSEPSIFVPLTQGTAFWLGALPPMARNVDLTFALGGSAPEGCIILPVKVRDRIVCFLYGDNAEAGVSGAPVGLLRRLVAKAGLAFQVYIMKSKIRLL